MVFAPNAPVLGYLTPSLNQQSNNKFNSADSLLALNSQKTLGDQPNLYSADFLADNTALQNNDVDPSPLLNDIILPQITSTQSGQFNIGQSIFNGIPVLSTSSSATLSPSVVSPILANEIKNAGRNNRQQLESRSSFVSSLTRTTISSSQSNKAPSQSKNI